MSRKLAANTEVSANEKGEIMKIPYAIRLRSAASVALALTTLAVLIVVPASSAHAQAFKSLYSFTGPSSGTTPYGAVLVNGKEGVLYGTTSAGGTLGFGTVYELSKKGETVLYSFTGGVDGSEPYAGLVTDSSGNLFGT